MINAHCDICGKETDYREDTFVTLTPASTKTGSGLNIRTTHGRIPSHAAAIEICPECMGKTLTINNIALTKTGFDHSAAAVSIR